MAETNLKSGRTLMMNSPTPETAVTQMLPNCNQRTKAMSGLYKLTADVTAALADPLVVVFLVFPPHRDKHHDIRLDLLDRARRSIPTLEYARVYTLREIVGAEWWDANLPKGHRIEGGETFAFLVAQGVFPLEFACHPERSNKTYRRV